MARILRAFLAILRVVFVNFSPSHFSQIFVHRVEAELVLLIFHGFNAGDFVQRFFSVFLFRFRRVHYRISGRLFSLAIF